MIITLVAKKYACAKMAEEYIDADVEGLTMSKKRKVEMQKTEKPEKVIKLDIPITPEVKAEPAIGLAEAAEMDFEFDTVTTELEKVGFFS